MKDTSLWMSSLRIESGYKEPHQRLHELESRDQSILRQWQVRLERAEYVVALAERRTRKSIHYVLLTLKWRSRLGCNIGGALPRLRQHINYSDFRKPAAQHLAANVWLI
jgi:hypothetical protein